MKKIFQFKYHVKALKTVCDWLPFPVWAIVVLSVFFGIPALCFEFPEWSPVLLTFMGWFIVVGIVGSESDGDFYY